MTLRSYSATEALVISLKGEIDRYIITSLESLIFFEAY